MAKADDSGSKFAFDYAGDIARCDISAFLKPVAVIGRLPDATGISQHLLSLHRTIADAVEMVVYDLYDQETLNTLAWDWPRYGAIIVTESIIHNPALVLMLRKLAGSLPRILILAWDSDELDRAEVDVLNQSFDTILADSEPLSRHWAKQVAPHVSWAPFPINLDLRARAVGVQPSSRRSWSPVIVGGVASFHPRKRHHLLVDAVADLVAEGEHLELILHSNLGHAEHYEETVAYAQQRLGERAIVTNDDKTPHQMNELYRTIDVFVSLSQGETFNIPVREALSAGKPAVISDIPGHHDLVGLPGVSVVPARIPVPAMYPERDGITAGMQYQCTLEDAKNALRPLVRQIKVGLGPDPYEVAESGLRSDFRVKRFDVIDTLRDAGALTFRTVRDEDEAAKKSPRRIARSLKSPGRSERKLIIVGHDAGFFSLYNTYASHVAWWESPNSFSQVIADWSIPAVQKGTGKSTFESFCYVAPDEGNLFFQLFESPYPDEAYDAFTPLDAIDGAEYLTDSFNAKVDPYLTYKHAGKLYRGLDFPNWRQRMNRVVNRALRPRADIVGIVKELRARVPDGHPTLSMHVRHPSHAIEQADGSIAAVRDYIRTAYGWLQLNPEGYILLATDQQSVVSSFASEFGERVVYRDGVARTTDEQDGEIWELAEQDQLTIGHQIQHLNAAEPSRWSAELARDVVIDAHFLATGDTLVHATSNVATAVAMMNPATVMYYVRGGDTWDDVRARSYLEQRTRVV